MDTLSSCPSRAIRRTFADSHRGVGKGLGLGRSGELACSLWPWGTRPDLLTSQVGRSLSGRKSSP